VTARKHQSQWELQALDPPALLAEVVVVLVGPKKPGSCGSVARSCSCFEVEQMRLVAPRCDHLSR
jgi:tRNA C32,U32 (ribose-2'-O)-methylase TrmJ